MIDDYFGNRSVNAFVDTYAELRAGTTNCNDLGDEGGHWAPSVYSGSSTTAMRPSAMTVYYRLGGKHPPSSGSPTD
jgi:hypothetical protein